MVGLLRGVNVGGKNKLAMSELRTIVAACGHEHVQTYIQSGNVVFESTIASTESVAAGLRTAVADATGLGVEVIVRTRHELAGAMSDNPFVEQGKDAAHLHVVFMGGTTDASLVGIPPADAGPDAAAAVGRQLYLYLPTGVGRSPLVVALSRRKGSGGTMRNWRTVTKLVEMADDT